MKKITFFILMLVTSISFAQEKNKTIKPIFRIRLLYK